MELGEVKGFIHSFQSLGATDGPGIRFVVFMQGCNLRCGYCHNPDTWTCGEGTLYSPEEIADKVERYKSYFGKEGGITVSGGEPLLQANFVRELFTLCKKRGINTCLDTSGSIMNDDILSLLDVCDRVLLDIKFTNDEDYKKHVGCSIQKPLEFLGVLKQKNIPTRIRHVVVPTLTDGEDNIRKIHDLATSHANVDKVELLPFRKICKTKYDNLGIEFSFDKYDTPNKELMDKLNGILL